MGLFPKGIFSRPKNGYRRGVEDYPRYDAQTELLSGATQKRASSPVPPTVTETIPSASARAKSNLVNLKFKPLVYTVNVALLFDISGSMPQEALRYAFGPGLKAAVETLLEEGPKRGLRYNLGLFAFNGTVKNLLPFTYAEDVDLKKLDFSEIEPSGVTCTEDAMKEVMAEIDRVKAEQDFHKVSREGTILICVTDGCPTNKEGYRVPLTPAFVEEMEMRNRTRKTISLAFGMGRVDPAVLTAIAPGYEIAIGPGETRTNPHAFIFKDPSYSDVSMWAQLMKVIALASSSSCQAEGAFGGYVSEPVFYVSGEEVPEYATQPIKLSSSFCPIYS